MSREHGSGTRSAYERAMTAAEPATEPVAPMLELSSTTAIKAAVENGIGAAVLSSLAVTTELARRSLVAVPVPGLRITRALTAIWPTGSEPAGPAADLIRAALADPGDRSSPSGRAITSA
ncbi:LysR substrate-binding domain-containing protein [Nocardia sp. NPDC057353]|uniref:LysR substrate-binding domain-containing protein n=1 Tax=Nocardia sp. NPDC057353 TaxID=3346104 RepID=UPI0036358017